MFIVIKEAGNSVFLVRTDHIVGMRTYEKDGVHSVKVFVKGIKVPSMLQFSTKEEAEDWIGETLSTIYTGAMQ